MKMQHASGIATSLLALSMFGQPALAAPPTGSNLPGQHVDIREVFVNDPVGSITISGYNFNFGSPLTVSLGKFPLLTLISSTAEIIEVKCPVLLSGACAMKAGDYLLIVSTGQGQSQNDE